MVTGTHPGTTDESACSARNPAPAPGSRRNRQLVEALFVAEVPVQDQVLALRVAHDPLAVAAELRVVRREELQPGERPLAELVDELALAEDALDLPVGRDRAQVDDPDVSDRGYLLELFGFLGHAGTPR